MYKPDHFKIYELIPQSIYNQHHTNEYGLWMLFDKYLLMTIDRLRERYGKLICNDWYWGGKWNQRGWRPWNTLTGSTFSQHKSGRAADLIPTEWTAEEIRQGILNNPWHPDFQYITCLETDITWLHIDVRNHDKEKDGILLVHP